MQLHSNARNREHRPRPARLQQFRSGSIFGHRTLTVRKTPDHVFVDAPDLGLNWISPIDFKRAVKHRAAPIETKRRRV